MLAKAREAVWKSGDWLSAEDVASQSAGMVGEGCFDPSEWVRSGKIFAIHWHNRDYYPGFGLDIRLGSSARPHPAMAELIKILGAKKSSWGMAFWFASVSSYLGGKRPQDLIESELDRVIAAAEDEIAGITHG